MKAKLLRVSLMLLMAMIGTEAFAKDSDWIMRLRALNVRTSVKSNVQTVGGRVNVADDTIPEFDVTRFFSENIAAELILGTSKHNVALKSSSTGDASLGSVNLLPPTLTAQYHFNPSGAFRPYAGAGLNYTFFYNAKSGDFNSVKYKNSLGYALQLGADYMINDRYSFNIDVKKIFLKTKATVNGSIGSNVRLDPWLFGAGIGYHF